MKSFELLDLERDLPTNSEDIAALRRLRRIRPRDTFKLLQALSDSLPASARRPRRRDAAGRPDLEL